MANKPPAITDKTNAETPETPEGLNALESQAQKENDAELDTASEAAVRGVYARNQAIQTFERVARMMNVSEAEIKKHRDHLKATGASPCKTCGKK